MWARCKLDLTNPRLLDTKVLADIPSERTVTAKLACDKFDKFAILRLLFQAPDSALLITWLRLAHVSKARGCAFEIMRTFDLTKEFLDSVPVCLPQHV
jgi:hypothetical protein